MATKKSVKAKKDKTVKKEEAKHQEINLKGFAEHLQEPLLIVASISLLLSMLVFWLNLGVSETGYKDAASNTFLLVVGLMLLALASAALCYMYIKSKRTSYSFAWVPALLFLATYFSWISGDSLGAGDFFTARDYATFQLFFGILGFMCALWLHRLVKAGTAAITAIFVTTLILHMTPAYTPAYAPWQGTYISDLDSYYWFRHANTILRTGYVPEKETLVYPKLPVSIDENGTLDSTFEFPTLILQSSVFMASLTSVLGDYGLGLHDIAMVYPGVISALIVLLLYLLIKEALWEMKPYNYAAAALGALMLMTNVSFASRAIATNCEDDTFGMFLMVASFLLFVMSYRRKSIPLSVLAGLSFFMLTIGWSGYLYATLVFGLLGVFYAVASYMSKKSCVEHVPYVAIPMLMSLLAPLVLRAQGSPPYLETPNTLFIMVLGGMLLVSFFLEALRSRGVAGKTSGLNPLDDLMTKAALPATVFLLLSAGFYVFFISSPGNLVNYAASIVIRGATQTDIIEMTTAEQRALCGKLDFGCINLLKAQFGMGVILGLGMIPILAYLALAKRNFGAAFILTWSVPMLYGVIYRSQYQFSASVPIIALGATAGAILALKKEDIQTFRLIPNIVLLFVFLLLPVFMGGMFVFGQFGGPTTMYMGGMSDRIYWDDTLNWIGTQANNLVVLTWWDYGHWITAVSDRISILDNTKTERFMVKDIAQFHVVTENETEALAIAKKYNSTYVVIDWTMIGKSGAPHFIGTSEFGEPIPLKRIGAEISCLNAVDCGNALDSDGYATVSVDKKGFVTIDLTTAYDINSVTLAIDNPKSTESYGYLIESSLDGSDWQALAEKTTNQQTEKSSFDTVRAQYLRITGTFASSGNEFGFTIKQVYNPRKDGSYMGYVQCGFNPDPLYSTITPKPIQNSQGGFDMVSRLFFYCNNGIGLVFDVRNGQYLGETYVVYGNNQMVPWSTWKASTGASILGVQPIQTILGNALNYPDRYANFPTFTTFVYVPKEEKYDFNKVMMTQLYLGEYLEEYQNAGLADAGIKRSESFKLVEGFRGDVQDDSYWGYVKVYSIDYPE